MHLKKEPQDDYCIISKLKVIHIELKREIIKSSKQHESRTCTIVVSHESRYVPTSIQGYPCKSLLT